MVGEVFLKGKVYQLKYLSLFRSVLNKIIRIRNIKIALMVQSIVTTCAVIYMMFQTSTLDDRLEIELMDGPCHGCCSMKNDTVYAISNEPRLSEKLHKFSRAIRKYGIPKDVMKILHDAEHKIEQFESELRKYETVKLDRVDELKRTVIEEDIATDQELVPKSKPRWQPESKEPEDPASKPDSKVDTNKIGTEIPNDVHNEIKLIVPI
jgi:hypothetical protein